MDYAACNVVYVDRAAKEDRLVKREDVISATSSINTPDHVDGAPDSGATLDSNLQTLLKTFSEVHVCTSGKSCVSKLSELNQASIVELIPTLVLIDIPYEDNLNHRPSMDARTPSPSSRLQVDGLQEEPEIQEAYGLKLLQWIASEIQYQSLSKLVVPVAVVSIPDPVTSRRRTMSKSDAPQISYDSFSSSKKSAGLVIPLDQKRTVQYLDVGAVDVLTSPLLKERLPSLGIHAYRAHRDASKDHRALLEMKRGRKRSWVGVDDQKPYAYLREAMVSGLMDGICKVGDDHEPLGQPMMRISIALDRRQRIAEAIASWGFSAHEFTDDELLHAALLMLQHALSMPELEKWRISTESLTGFLVASRSAYNAFVPYHNFRHVVDVLQAIFNFLVTLGRLPPYPSTTATAPSPSPIAALIRPFDALTLLITAIGHDVGHPGVNNAFLVTLNAPLAQLYNDRSVLESFHCAAYSQILRRHWPAAFQGVEMRQLMISSILATDMQLHFDYMKKLGWMQEKLHENGGTDGWNGRLMEEQRTLACSLLIKCADISNIARKFDVASQWTMILTDEFARQASMEQDLGIPSALYAAPVREIVELGKSQLSFMNIFAIPLFAGVADVMPAMQYTVDELHMNKSAWEAKIEEEQAKSRSESDDLRMMDGMFSPRSMSLATPSDASQRLNSVSSTARSTSESDQLRIKAMLSKSPFSPLNGTLEEYAEPHDHPLPELSTTSPTDSQPSPSDVHFHSPSKPIHLPTQLQISSGTASAPGLLDHPSKDPDFLLNGDPAGHVNGIEVEPSLVTDAVVVPPAIKTSEKQRSSDTTNASAENWAEEATSATSGKMPLSPSTQGTSIMSDDSVEKSSTPTAGSPLASRSREDEGNEEVRGRKEEGKGVLMETVRNLRKKPSRFRMNSLNFWRRSKSASPPIPTGLEGGRRGVGSEDEGGGAYY